MKTLKQIVKSTWNKMKIGVASALVGATLLANNSRAESSNWLSLELEPIKFGTESAASIHIGNIPEYLRNVPVHHDDSYVPLSPLPNSQLDITCNSRIMDLLNLKIWFFDIIGVGIGLGGGIDTSRSAGQRYDYSVHYGNWGPAFVMYNVGLNSDQNLFKYFFELKTPMIQLWNRNDEEEQRGISFFAGYEPNIESANLTAFDGWRRYGSTEVNKSYDLGKISYDRLYAGIDLKLSKNSARTSGDLLSLTGIRFYCAKDIGKTEFTEAASDFNITTKDPSLLFGGSVYLKHTF